MFGKRRRTASNPVGAFVGQSCSNAHANKLAMQPLRAPPSASASLAATKAFAKDRESNPTLSNAAAAAALRTHVTTPTPVGDTVTKRMVRRNSASSSGSGAGQRPGGLQRQSSSGSMTERTFRSPSPGRGSPADPNAPPVPAMPKNLAQTGAVHRRASSLEPTFRGGSPSPRGGGRGVSLDRGTGKNTAARGQRATSNLTQVLEDDMDANQRSSVNFSRPMSPASAARQNASKGWYGGPIINQEAVRNMAASSRPRTSASIASNDLHHATDQPARTHQVSRSVEGSHLANGGMRAKPSGTAVQSRSFLPSQGPVDPKSPDAIFDPSTRTFIRKQDAMTRHRELHEEPEQPNHQYIAQHVDDYRPLHAPQQHRAPRTPSPVREPTRRVEPEAVQRQQEMALPRLDTNARMRYPEDLPTGVPTPDTRKDTAFERERHGSVADVDSHHSEQANTNRKLENSSVQPVPIDIMVSPNFAYNQDSSYPKLPPPVVPTTTNSLAAQGHGSARVTHDRGHSLSPPRYAHFAPMAVELAGTKHQPPPRSISPAKSALKASPSASRRGSSPIAPNGRLLSRGAASETSDTNSEGGSKMKKRDVRVSFEDAPVVAGTSAYADAGTPTSPVGLDASKWSSTRTEKDNEFGDFMKPRPALPTFGSVREREGRTTQDDAPEKVTETVSSTPMSASAASLGEPLHASSDQVVGGILAQNFAHKQAVTNDPLPPEVTTVEGSGYVSDSSDDVGLDAGTYKHGSMDDSSQILSVPEPKSLTASYDEQQALPAPVSKSVADVPEIALLPATPSPLDHPEPKYQSMVIPGGWNDEPHSVETKSGVPEAAPAVNPASFQPVPFQPIEPPTSLQSLIARDEDSSDDNSSVYSDAYEDLSDTEGGFGSINAIMESPVASSTPGLMNSKHADTSIPESYNSGLRKEVVEEDRSEPVTTPSGGWDAAKEHWSGVNQSLKQPSVDTPSTREWSNLENTVTRVLQAPVAQAEPSTQRRIEPRTAAAPKTNEPTQSQNLQPSSRPLKSALKKAAVSQPSAAEPHIRKTMRGPPPRDERAVEPHIRKTMRGPPPGGTRSSEPQMRSTLRTGGNTSPQAEPQMRLSMRAAESTATGSMGLAASRYSMPPAETKPPRGALQKRNIPMPTTPPKSRPQSVPAATAKPGASVPTYDSDSDGSASSFQRTRARRRNQGASTMRSSMRQGPAPTMRTSAPAPAPIRSISPPASPKPAIRKSMRPSSPTPELVKSSKFSIRSLSPMGRFRSSKAIEAAPSIPVQPKVQGFAKQTNAKAPATERAKPAFSSRFADSSGDEDDSRTPRFQSRFADSDDDEPGDYKLPPGLAPVRGIPRRQGDEDGDSTDLEEEVDETPLPTASAAKEMGAPAVSNSQTNGHANGQGATLAAGSLRDSKHAPLPSFDGGKKKAKRGFFGMGKKKAATTPVVTSVEVAPSTPTKILEPVPASPTEIPLPPPQRKREPGFPLTPIDEDKDFGSPVQASPQSRKAPKLQRRSTPEWPLPPVPSIPLDERPMSSDGIAPRRPRFQMRQSSTMSTATAPIGETPGRTVSYGRSGKKKKFQGLRRVFGLND
jgi:serine/arginine repetitive matrix protein 2